MMKNDLMDHDFEDISTLIRKEEEDALAYFRSRNFGNRLETRLKEKTKDAEPATSIHLRRVTILAGIMALIIAGVLIFTLRRPSSVSPPEFGALASALAQLPGLSQLPGKDWPALPGQTGTSRLAESVREALIAVEQIKTMEEQRISLPGGASKIPSLSLDQKMEILFQEKTIERVLFILKGHPKEV